MALVIAPAIASAATVAELQTQLQSLRGQIAALQAQGGESTCPSLSRTLSLRMRGDDVRALQKFLIAQGLLAAGNDTGYFGKLTQAAAQSFQHKNNIVTSGTPATTGYGLVGPKTRAAIARVCRSAPPLTQDAATSPAGTKAVTPPNMPVCPDCTRVTPQYVPSSSPTPDSLLACGISQGRLDQIHTLLDTVVDYSGPEHLMASASDGANYPQVIYDLQEITANVLQAGENCEDTYILDKLASLYAIPFNHLKADPQGNMVWPNSSGYEEPLDSTQFMYPVAKLINVIVHIDETKWTPAMRSFVYSTPNGPRQYLIAHLDRWMNKKSMWTWTQCGVVAGSDGLREYTFPEYVQKKTARTLGYASGAPVYCNAILEPELWVAAAATELIDADTTSHYWIGLDPALKSQLTAYARDAVHLMESRITEQPACSDGRCVGGLLDSGAWRGHPEHPAEYWPNGGEIFDISHMRRIVPWFDTFYRHPDITQPAYDLDGITKLFGNELAYKIFNGNYTDPAFTNFWNGSNVNYPRGHITYGPYELSSDYFRSGYGFWAPYRGDIGKINTALTAILDARTPTTYMTPDGTPPGGAYDLLGLYSSLTHRPQ